MGLSLSVHMGPYIEAVNSTVKTTVKVRGCPTHSTTTRMSSTDKFCHRCGTALVDMEIEKDGHKVNPLDFIEDGLFHYVDDEERKRDLFLPDILNDNRRNPNCDIDDATAVPVSPQQVADEMASFEKDYKDDIEAMRLAYGPSNVSIKWGLVQWYN